LRDTPGASAAAWATPSTSPSFAAAAQLLAPVGDQHQRRARQQAEGGRPGPAEPLLDLPLEPVADRRRGQEGERQEQRPTGVEAAQLRGDQPPLADQERRRGTGVEGDLEALAHLGVDRVPIPARQPGDEDDVGGAGDRQQLGGALDDPEEDRPARRQRAAAQAPGVAAGCRLIRL
jgi:hypothetical protein